MAWALWINSANATAAISRGDDDEVEIDLTLNERGTARFVCLSSLVPDRFAPVQIFAQDGTTLIYGGLVQKRRSVPRPGKLAHYRTAVEASDYGLYAEWCTQTKTYTSSVALGSVVGDLVTDKLGAYGITLSSSQVAGPTLAPFTWTAYRVSDALRELSDRTGYTWQVWPDKTLELFIPGTYSAPHSITGSAQPTLQADWNDPDAIPANKVVVICGPAATATIEQQWVASGSEGSWVTDIPAGGGTAGYVTVNSIFLTVTATAGDAAHYNWNQTTHTLSVGSLGNTPTAGQVIALNYVAQYPFVVTATTGSSPVIEATYSREDITAYAQGLSVAQGLLTQLASVSAEISLTSKDTGWQPGQELPVVLSARDINATYVITDVRVRLETDNRWISDIEAVNASVYQGSYLERWREMAGQGSSTGITVLPDGIAGGLPGPIYLGGSRFHAVQVEE
jgi:hypothetical protein